MRDSRPSGTWSGGARQILVVDDEAVIRDSIVELLRQYGYAALGATDGRDALTQLRASPDRWSVILLDLSMPRMDGRAFREEQRRDPALASIPVIVLSGRRDADRQAEDLAVTAYVTKPPEIGALLAVVARVHRTSSL
jgi:CheY-like chemotaxis protein